ncbi:MAG: ABC transporter ATP-binding protein [Oscillospiraceae bacterium]|nr:ABC transporter ATP-binding protein [Oscillospiraceae bacterium]
MIKKLAASIREFKKETILTPAVMVLEVVMEMIIPLLMAKLIDNGINGNGGAGDMPYILWMGAVLVVCCVLSLIFGVLGGRFAATASAGFARNLRMDLYHRVQDFSFGNIDKFSTSSLITRLTTDVTNIQNAFQMIIRIAVRAPMTLIIAAVMAASISPKLSTVYLCFIPVLALGLFLVMSKAHPIFRRMFKIYDRMNNTVQENLRGVRVVKSFVREEHENEKFNEVSGDIYKTATTAERIVALNGPLMNFCMFSCMLIIAWVGGQMIVSTGSVELSTGELISFIGYALQILSSLMMVAMILLMIVISRASAERVTEVLNELPDITSPAAPVTEVPDGSVRFENVSFSYAKSMDKLCLTDVNLDIKSGQTVGILGGTGSSKSTMVQLISRLYDVTAGRLLVGGHDVRDYDLQVLRDSVAVVLQKNVLFSGTIKENLRWGNPDATDEELIHACRLACADEFIQGFPEGYDTYIEQGGANVSGGQKQRLCIARALLKKPKVLILDDSTSAVDTRTDAMIRQAFREEIPGTTKFIIAQRISSVQDADVIVILDGGRIVDCGTHEQLLATSEIYQETYEQQKKGGEDDE